MIKRILILFVLSVVLVSYVFPKKLAVLPQLIKPGVIAIDGEAIYVLDGVEVYVYSPKDYQLVNKFGKRGSGPGELIPNDEIPLHMKLVNGNIFLNSQTKMIYYSKRGNLIKEKTLPFMCMQIVPLGDGFAVSKVAAEKNGEITFNVVLCDARCKPVKILTALEKNDASRRGKIVIPPPYIYLHCTNDMLFVTGGNKKDFHIEIFDKKGNPLPPIQQAYQRLRLSDSFKNELLDWFKTDNRFKNIPLEVFRRLHYQPYLPAVRDVVVTPNRVYVQTYKQKSHDSEFFVFTLKGKPLKRVFLPTATRYKVKLNADTVFTFYNNAYYYLLEGSDSDHWELHMEEIN
jgi:hypothetical protein